MRDDDEGTESAAERAAGRSREECEQVERWVMGRDHQGSRSTDGEKATPWLGLDIGHCRGRMRESSWLLGGGLAEEEGCDSRRGEETQADLHTGLIVEGTDIDKSGHKSTRECEGGTPRRVKFECRESRSVG